MKGDDAQLADYHQQPMIMKTDQLLSHLQPRRSAFLRLGLVASLCLGVSATAIAKKGGGKPGGG